MKQKKECPICFVNLGKEKFCSFCSLSKTISEIVNWQLQQINNISPLNLKHVIRNLNLFLTEQCNLFEKEITALKKQFKQAQSHQKRKDKELKNILKGKKGKHFESYYSC